MNENNDLNIFGGVNTPAPTPNEIPVAPVAPAVEVPVAPPVSAPVAPAVEVPVAPPVSAPVAPAVEVPVAPPASAPVVPDSTQQGEPRVTMPEENFEPLTVDTSVIVNPDLDVRLNKGEEEQPMIQEPVAETPTDKKRNKANVIYIIILFTLIVAFIMFLPTIMKWLS